MTVSAPDLSQICLLQKGKMAAGTPTPSRLHRAPSPPSAAQAAPRAHGRTGPHGYQGEEPPGTKVPSAPVPSTARRGREGRLPLHPGGRSPPGQTFQNWTLGTCFLMAGFCAPHGINPTRLGSASWHRRPWVFCLSPPSFKGPALEVAPEERAIPGLSSRPGCPVTPAVTTCPQLPREPLGTNYAWSPEAASGDPQKIQWAWSMLV